MRYTRISTIDSGHDDDANLYVMFHGYGNDESEMVRILGAIDPDADYISFRGPLHREYLGGNAWYEQSATDELIQRRCSEIGDDLVDMLDSTALHTKRIIPVGFSQGGYLAYRLLIEHPDIFETAVLLSPAFHDDKANPNADSNELEESFVLQDITDSQPRVFLGYGDMDEEITPDEQQAMRTALAAFAKVDNHVYPGLRHNVNVEEFADIRKFLAK